MRIETESTGASRYRGGRSLLPLACVVATAGFCISLMVHAHVRLDDQRDRIAALERESSVAAQQAALTVPHSYSLIVDRLGHLELDIESCHGRWDATYSQLEDFWGVFIGGPIPPGKRYPLPNRPPAPPERLPADYCGLVASVPAGSSRAFLRHRLWGPVRGRSRDPRRCQPFPTMDEPRRAGLAPSEARGKPVRRPHTGSRKGG